MPIFDTFAKRMARVRNAGKPILYKYEEFPTKLRVQVVHILRDTMQDTIERIPHSGSSVFDRTHSSEEGWWRTIHDTLAKEMGEFEVDPINRTGG